MHEVQRQLTSALVLVSAAAVGTFSGVNYSLFVSQAHQDSAHLVEQIIRKNPDYIPGLSLPNLEAPQQP